MRTPWHVPAPARDGLGGQAFQLGDSGAHRHQSAFGLASQRDRQRSTVRDPAQERVHVVREGALLAQLEEEPARHALTENDVEDVGREAPLVAVRRRACAEDDVRLAGAPVEQVDGVPGRRGGGRGSTRAPPARPSRSRRRRPALRRASVSSAPATDITRSSRR